MADVTGVRDKDASSVSPTASPAAETPGTTEPAAPAPWLARARRLSVVGLLVVAGTVLQLLRQPGVPSWDSLWQEDGSVFLNGGVNDPFHAITVTYNGYLHVVPRLLALVLARFPLEWTPLLFSAATALLVSLIAVYAWTVSATVFHTMWARGLMALHLVLLPAAAYEVNADLANLHWYLIYAAFWALLDRPPNRARAILAAVVTLSAAVSDSLTGLLLPLVVARLVRRGPYRWTAAAGWVVGMLLQVLVTSAAPKPYTAVVPTQLPATYGLRVGGSFLFTDRFLLEIRDWGGDVLCYALLVAALAAGVGAILLMRRRQRTAAIWLAVAAFGYSLAFLVIPLLLRGTYLLRGRTLNGARYEVLPVLFLGLVVLLVIEGLGAADRPAGWPIWQWLATAVIGGGLLVGFSTPAVRSQGPSWHEALVAGRALCDGRPAPSLGSLVRLGPHDTVRLPDSPAGGRKVPFPTSIPCDRLR